MNIDFVLHVGLQKTGTTTLQRTLFANHPEIFYLGKSPKWRVRKGCRTQEIYDLLAPAIWQQRGNFDAEALRAKAQQEVAPGATDKAVSIGSWEALGNGSTRKFEEMLRRLALIFGQCRVMICLRNPSNWAASLYFQELEGHFKKRNRAHLGSNVYMDFEQWLKIKAGSAATGGNLFNYGRNIQRAVELFGHDRVGVFVFEELLDDPRAFYARICEFLRIDVDEGLRLTEDRRFNPTLTEPQLQLLRKTQASFLKRCAWRFRSQRSRTRTLDALTVEGADKARVEIPRATAAEIEEDSRPENRWLAAEFGLPLGKYGYAV